jgi:hypothetical protein
MPVPHAPRSNASHRDWESSVEASEPILPANRPSRLYTYWVAGKGEFPYDMLRYDRAWPVEHVGDIPRKGEERTVKLRSHKPPTPARWASFWWFVSPSEPSASSKLWAEDRNQQK